MAFVIIVTRYHRQLALGVKYSVAFGLLCEWFACSLFEMNLRAEGVYMSVIIKCFSLVSNESELMSIPVIVEAIGFVKDKFVDFEAKYKGRNS
ncbi:hypothetical protein BDF21DRAFT_419709 [Thamnidium elegans]|nr:hypothetical protein BDF21DRAFT_419709 [Thamnidium elegans]